MGRAGLQHGWELAEHGEQGTGHRGWLGQGCALFQYHLLPQHYQVLLVTAFLILSLAEGSRLYLGYVGNLQEKVSTISLRGLGGGQTGLGSCGGAGCPLAQDPSALSLPVPPGVLPGAVLGGNGSCRQDVQAGDGGDPLALLLYPSPRCVCNAPAPGLVASNCTQAQLPTAGMSPGAEAS